MGHFQRSWPSQFVHPTAPTVQLQVPSPPAAPHVPHYAPNYAAAAPAPGWAPPRKKRREWLVQAILIAIVVSTPFLTAFGSVAWMIYSATKGPRDRAHAFADAVHDRKFEKARAMLVDDLQQEMSPAKFREQMDDSHFSHAQDLSFHGVYVQNRSACLDGEVNGLPVNFRLEKVRDEWRIRSTERGNFCR